MKLDACDKVISHSSGGAVDGPNREPGGLGEGVDVGALVHDEELLVARVLAGRQVVEDRSAAVVGDEDQDGPVRLAEGAQSAEIVEQSEVAEEDHALDGGGAGAGRALRLCADL